MDASQLFWLGPAGSLLALVFSYYFYSLYKESDNEKTKLLSGYIEEGTKSYLTSQYKIVGLYFIILFAIFAFLSYVLEIQNPWIPIAFLTGGLLSAFCGYFGLKVATKSCICTINSATTSLNSAFQTVIRTSSVLGFIVSGLCLLDITIWWKILNYVYSNHDVFKESIFAINSYTEITNIMLSFGIGAISQTIFAKIGGGIFTNAAKFSVYQINNNESDISIDESHNPAAISDNVGNNVCDAIGSAAEFYDTYCITILTAMTLGAAAFNVAGLEKYQLNSIFLPLAIAGSGIVFSIFGIYSIKANETPTKQDLMKSISRGSSFAALFIALGSIALVNSLLPNHIPVLGSIIIGLMGGIIIGWSTNYHTSEDYEPTNQLIEHSNDGIPTLITEGLINGLQSSIIPLVTIGLTALLAYGFAGGFSNTSIGFYGIAMSAIGMLSTISTNVALTIFAPIAANAAKITTNSDFSDETKKSINILQSVGKQVAPIGKGFIIASASITSLALVGAYFEELKQALLHIANFSGKELSKFVFPNPTTQIPIEKASISDFLNYYSINPINPVFLLGCILGLAVILLFCALSLKAIYEVANKTVEEVQRQYKEIPGLAKGEEKADYASCASVASYSIQKNMISPIAIAIIIPALTGLILGPSAVIGMLLFAVITGFTFATILSNASSSWENTNNHIENSEKGKDSECYKFTKTSNNIGHPLMDVAGSSLNTILKFICMISIVFVGATANYSPVIQDTLGLNPSEIRYPKEFAKANGMSDYEDITYSSNNSSSIYEDPLLGTEDIILPTDESLLRPQKKNKANSDSTNTKNQRKDTNENQNGFSSNLNNKEEKKSNSTSAFGGGFDSFESNDNKSENKAEKTNSSSGFDSGFGGGFDSFESNDNKSENKAEKTNSNSGFDSGFGGGFDSFESNDNKSENKAEKTNSSSGFDSGFGGGFDSFESNDNKSENKAEKTNSSSGFDSGFGGGFDSFESNDNKSENKAEKTNSSSGFDSGFGGGFDSFEANENKSESKTENTNSNSGFDAGFDGGFDSLGSSESKTEAPKEETNSNTGFATIENQEINQENKTEAVESTNNQTMNETIATTSVTLENNSENVEIQNSINTPKEEEKGNQLPEETSNKTQVKEEAQVLESSEPPAQETSKEEIQTDKITAEETSSISKESNQLASSTEETEKKEENSSSTPKSFESGFDAF